MTSAPMKVLVTGASGTLGFNLIDLLLRTGQYDIYAPIRQRQPFLDNLQPNVRFVLHDFEDERKTIELVNEICPDVVVHCAASGVRPPRTEWFKMVAFNVSGSISLFKAYCGLPASSHFIYISTGLVYQIQGRPLREDDPVGTLHPYGAGKAAADSLLLSACAEFKRSITILRPFAFTGKHDGQGRLFPSLLRAAESGTEFSLTRGDQVRDFCAAEDVARCILRCIERRPRSPIEIFNVGSGRSLPIRALVEQVCNELGLSLRLNFGSAPLPAFEPSHLVADISRARQELGWSPETNLAFAVWQLAKEVAPDLKLTEPRHGFNAD